MMSVLKPLTPQERKYVALLSTGLSGSEICKQLRWKRNTLDCTSRAVRRKIGVTTTNQLLLQVFQQKSILQLTGDYQ